MKQLKKFTLEELSMAGSPEKMMEIYRSMRGKLREVDKTNAAELVNVYYVLQRLLAENHYLVKRYETKTGQRIGLY